MIRRGESLPSVLPAILPSYRAILRSPPAGPSGRFAIQYISLEVTLQPGMPIREPHAMPTTVGERVRRLRTDRGLTQDDLAQKAGISKGFLSDLENGKRSIGAETLLDLGRAMGVSLDFLMTGEDSTDHGGKENIPSSLARFAAEEGLSVRETLTLLHIQEQIMTARKVPKKRLESLNWKEFYEAVKRFL